MKSPQRVFEDKPAERESVPIWIGLAGASSSGKTWTALELATGIQSITGGDVFVCDTESKRALHYADNFTFRHVNFEEPFSSTDYLAAIHHCQRKGAKTVVIDSFSHQHTGPGGLLDQHETELDRMAGSDAGKRERCKLLAWQKPKAEERMLLTKMLHSGLNFILCFRAKQTSKPVKNAQGKMEVENQGFVAESSPIWVFECTVNLLLMPQSDGVPTLRTDYVGERMSIKIPNQFRSIISDKEPLSRDTGRILAEWARGGKPKDLVAEGEAKAREGSEALKTWWESVPPNASKKAAAAYLGVWKEMAAAADAAQAEEPLSRSEEEDFDQDEPTPEIANPEETEPAE